jgi:hydroxyacylglutathione hydrolase
VRQGAFVALGAFRAASGIALCFEFGSLSAVNVEPIACLADNYAYLIWREGSRGALLVDPSESIPVLRALQRHQLTLEALLCTHHHWDHIGGIQELCHVHPGLPVFCSDSDVSRISGATQGIGHGKSFDVAGLHFDCLKVPGHTLGALAYCVESAVFTGDTLFGAGCGRLFEGTAAQMHASLMLLASLPGQTKVYFGHEYTKANLAFARTVEPDNPELRARWELIQRSATEPTTPSTIEEERKTNPFLRCAEAGVRLSLGADFAQSSDTEVFSEVRRRKDGYRA